MTPQERNEYQNELRLLKELHQIYLDMPQLGGSDTERTDHMLVIMETIYEIQQLLNNDTNEPADDQLLD